MSRVPPPERDESAVESVLEGARARGFLGPGPVERHIAHSRALADALGEFSGRFLDLGSGGGIPGLVLAMRWPSASAVLLDVAQRRCRFLETAIERLGFEDRAEVRCGRAEDLARDPGLRGTFQLVVSRGFAAPPVVAECAVGFLAPGGRLVVSEPPGGSSDTQRRWPAAPLRELGLEVTAELRSAHAGAVVLSAREPASEKWPRRVGVPGKRPLW